MGLDEDRLEVDDEEMTTGQWAPPSPKDRDKLMGLGLALDVPNEWPAPVPIKYEDLGPEYRYTPKDEDPEDDEDPLATLAAEEEMLDAEEALTATITVTLEDGTSGSVKLQETVDHERITAVRRLVESLSPLDRVDFPGVSIVRLDGGDSEDARYYVKGKDEHTVIGANEALLRAAREIVA